MLPSIFLVINPTIAAIASEMGSVSAKNKGKITSRSPLSVKTTENIATKIDGIKKSPQSKTRML